MYTFFRSLLFALKPEKAHQVALSLLKYAHAYHLLPLKKIDDPYTCMGLKFPNRLGLAAGLDKNGDYINALGQLGFGFIEVGTITPKAQPGNPKPRLFRLKKEQAIINRLGFNNKGVDYLIENLKTRTYQGILGINIGKNKTTPLADSIKDYLYSFDRVYPWADYITINISSPNTPGLRILQHQAYLPDLLTALKEAQKKQADKTGRYVPLAVKLSPDLDKSNLKIIANQMIASHMDAVIATNTTKQRPSYLNHLKTSHELGGLSGPPLSDLSTHAVATLYRILGNALPIIGVGGISEPQDALRKIKAGAALVQIYTSFIYNGPFSPYHLAKSITTEFNKI